MDDLVDYLAPFLSIISSCFTHSSDESAICGGWEYLLFQSHIPTVDIMTGAGSSQSFVLLSVTVLYI